ncbi:CAT RNA binding domain-containing protein [Edwardsiella anguillarum]|nr:CAT RNA binding domain-containing protein [Edwardsiella anguillarum]
MSKVRFFCFVAVADLSTAAGERSGDDAHIANILNNNVILALDSRQRELVMMGRGLAFHQCVGDILDEGRIEKIFTLQCNRLNCRSHDMILHLPWML